MQNKSSKIKKRLLSIRDLHASYYTYRGIIYALSGIFLDIDYGEMFAVVGETGCGKSTLGHAIPNLIPSPGKIDRGEIILEGEDLMKKTKDEMMEIRRHKIAMIFQDPTAALNPVFRVGDQMALGIRIAKGKTKSEAKEETVKMLSAVEIPDPSKVARQYPHELSGGMKQRVVIAIALMRNPKLLIADEPTSNLDVTIQAQILDLITGLREKIGMSIFLITHDMGVVAQTCDKVGVMYAGSLVEVGKKLDVFKRPEHPYTKGLLQVVTLSEEEGRLQTIPGTVPDLTKATEGCRFYPRCSSARKVCSRKRPKLLQVASEHYVACHPSSQ